MSPLFTGNFFGFRGAGGAVMAPIILSTSQSTVNNTITLGTVSAGNTIVIFAEKGDTIGTAPSGFTQRVLSNDSEGASLAVYTKVSTGGETTITGDWEVAASWVIDGIVSVVGTPQGSTASTTSTAPSINVLSGSLVAFVTVCNTNQTVTTPPVEWTQEVRVDGAADEIYVYSRVYGTAQATGSVTAIWSGQRVNSVLISFVK